MFHCDGHVVLCDFGLGRVTSSHAAAGAVPVPSIRGGTLEYLAPELLDDERRVATFASDIFALGLAYCLVTGAPHPWHGYCLGRDGIPQLVRQGDRPDPLLLRPDVPSNLLSWINKCWSQDAKGRPTATEALSMLRDMSGSVLDIPTESLAGKELIDRIHAELMDPDTYVMNFEGSDRESRVVSSLDRMFFPAHDADSSAASATLAVVAHRNSDSRSHVVLPALPDDCLPDDCGLFGAAMGIPGVENSISEPTHVLADQGATKRGEIFVLQLTTVPPRDWRYLRRAFDDQLWCAQVSISRVGDLRYANLSMRCSTLTVFLQYQL